MQPLSVETIDKAFDEATNQTDYALALYRAVYPDWDDITSVDGFPAVSRDTGLYIMDKAMTFDRDNHPDVFAGGLWLNNGFSVLDNDGVEDWTVRPAPTS